MPCWVSLTLGFGCSFHFVSSVYTVITGLGGGEFEGKYLQTRIMSERLHKEIAQELILTIEDKCQWERERKTVLK